VKEKYAGFGDILLSFWSMKCEGESMEKLKITIDWVRGNFNYYGRWGGKNNF
jgi:hypothetical protein